MLCKDLMNRVYKLKQVKLHPYFKDFDWEALKSLNLEVPFVSKKITKEVKFTSSTPYDTFIKVMLKLNIFRLIKIGFLKKDRKLMRKIYQNSRNGLLSSKPD